MFLRIHLTSLSCWPFTQKHSFLDVWRGSEYACVQIAPGNVLSHHNKHLMGYFEFLNASRIRTHRFIFVNTIQCPRTLKNNIYHSNKQEPPPFYHSDTNAWPRSGPFCWQNPCFGCNSGIDLVVGLEYIFFQLCSNTEQIS